MYKMTVKGILNPPVLTRKVNIPAFMCFSVFVFVCQCVLINPLQCNQTSVTVSKSYLASPLAYGNLYGEFNTGRHTLVYIMVSASLSCFLKGL